MHRLLPIAVVLALAVDSPAVAQNQASVEMELLTETGFPITGQQQWARLMTDLGVIRLRIRSGRDGEPIQIVKRGSDASPLYHVTGQLTSRNTLRLPGRVTFRLGDREALSKWIENLKTHGPEQMTSPKAAFGLTANQLVELHEKLAVPVRQSTKGRDSAVVVEEIVRNAQLPVEPTPAARRGLAADQAVLDELQNISSGTALAAVLRPLGLVLVPYSERGKAALRIADAQEAEENWPIGWPSEKAPGQTAPALFKFLDVSVNDTPLLEAMEAISQRVEIPLLWDHNSMARNRINPATVNVTLPQNRTFYKKIIDDILRQGELRVEIRLDEADHLLLWITTIKQN